MQLPRRIGDVLEIIAVCACAAVAARDGARGRHHRRAKNPRWRPDPDRQHPHPARRHRRAVDRPALPQHQGRTLDLRRRRARRTDPSMSATRAGPATPARPTAAAAWWRDARSTARTSRNGWCRTDGRWPTSASPMITMPTKRPRARPRPGCGRARSSRRGTGASATRRRPFWAPPSRRRTPMRSCWHRRRDRSRPRPTAPSRATSTASGECIYHQPTSRWYAKIQMTYQQGHALVLLGRGRRSRRLPRDQTIGMIVSENRLPALADHAMEIAAVQEPASAA